MTEKTTNIESTRALIYLYVSVLSFSLNVSFVSHEKKTYLTRNTKQRLCDSKKAIDPNIDKRMPGEVTIDEFRAALGHGEIAFNSYQHQQVKKRKHGHLGPILPVGR